MTSITKYQEELFSWYKNIFKTAEPNGFTFTTKKNKYLTVYFKSSKFCRIELDVNNQETIVEFFDDEDSHVLYGFFRFFLQTSEIDAIIGVLNEFSIKKGIVPNTNYFK